MPLPLPYATAVKTVRRRIIIFIGYDKKKPNVRASPPHNVRYKKKACANGTLKVFRAGKTCLLNNPLTKIRYVMLL
jgi:hypothetical protein